MSGKITIDPEQFPKIFISVKEEIEEEDVDVFYEEMTKILQEHPGKFLIISDQRNGKLMNISTRKKLGRTLQAISDNYKSRELGIIIINDSVIGSTMIYGLLLLLRPQKNFHIFMDEQKAQQKANEIIAKIA